MSNDLFDASNNDPQGADENHDYLAEYVGEGKKFNDYQGLARGKFESDRFITKLQAENAEMREELQKVSRLQDMIDRLSKVEKPGEGSDNHDDDQRQSAPNVDIEKLIEEKLLQKEANRTRQANLAEAQRLLKEKLGPNYVDKLEQKANTLGLSKDDLNALAARSPQAFIALVAPGQPQAGGVFAPPAGSSQSTTFSSSSPDRTQKWYADLKKSNPDQYWSASTQMQMHKDAIRLQEKFFDT